MSCHRTCHSTRGTRNWTEALGISTRFGHSVEIREEWSDFTSSTPGPAAVRLSTWGAHLGDCGCGFGRSSADGPLSAGAPRPSPSSNQPGEFSGLPRWATAQPGSDFHASTRSHGDLADLQNRGPEPVDDISPTRLGGRPAGQARGTRRVDSRGTRLAPPADKGPSAARVRSHSRNREGEPPTSKGATAARVPVVGRK